MMSVEYTYTVRQLSTIDTDGYEKIVVFAVATLQGFDGQKYASLGFSERFTFDASKPFTPFQDLTEAEVVQWLKDAAGPAKIAELESKVASWLAEPDPFMYQPLPWQEGQS